MNKEKEFLLWFEQMERGDVAIVGGKSSSLGEMTSKTDVPVPYGFATTAYAYRYFIEKSGLKEKMQAILAELTDVENSALLRDVSARLREAIMAEEMPEDLKAAIAAAYEELGKKVGEAEPYVAVRSSATAEDLPDASFAGQQDTYLNVKGAENIIAKVKECYASCFTDRAVYYREKQGFDHIEVALSAVIQMMVFSKAAGVMFTVNVATGDDSNILIEAAFGLGEYVVQGTVTPDNYTVSKAENKIVDRCVNEQDVMLVRKEGGDCEELPVPEAERNVQTLTDEQILELAGYAKKLKHIMAAIWIWNGALIPATAKSGFSRHALKPYGAAAIKKTNLKLKQKQQPPTARLSLKACPQARALYPAALTLSSTRPISTSSRKAKSL